MSAKAKQFKRRGVTVLLAAILTPMLLPLPGPPPVQARYESVGVTGASSGFQSVGPARLLDTRVGGSTIDGLASGSGAVSDGAVVDIRVAGRGGIPVSGADSVVLNVVAANSSTPGGFLTVFPTGSQLPNSSALNYAPGEVRSVAVLAKVGIGGSVSVYAYRSAEIIVDVVGWFPSGGTFSSVVPARLADTRRDAATVDGASSGVGRVPAGATLDVAVAGRGGVPSAGVSAVAVTVTAAAPDASGFLTVHQTGTPRPEASNLNYVAASTVANLVVVDVSASGSISVYSSASTEVIVDVVGWFSAGELNSVAPARLLDMRPGGSTIDGQCRPGWKNTTGETFTLMVAGRGGVPASGVGTVVLNVTAVSSMRDGGFLTVHPSGSARPNASSLNYGVDSRFNAGRLEVRNGATANLVFAELGADGAVSLYSWVGAHLLVDVVGWMPGTAAASGPVCAPPPFDADAVQIEWLRPLTSQVYPDTVSVSGLARLVPPLYKVDGGALTVVLKTANDTGVAAYVDNATSMFGTEIQQDWDNVKDFGTTFVGFDVSRLETATVAQVCIGRSGTGGMVEDCRPALPHEAVSVMVPAS